MSVIQGNAIESGVAEYKIERSLRFNFADSAYLNRTPGSATNRTTWTYSYWFKGIMLKPGVNDYWALSAFSDGNNFTAIRHHNEYYIDVLSFTGGSAVAVVKTQKVFRDPSAWNHILVTFDTGNATQTDRVRIYHNGVRCDIRAGATYPGAGSPTGFVNNNTAHYIGSQTTEYFDGYMTEINLIDGQALDPTSFGEYNSDTGVWQPKAYTGSYGTNGFYLNFSDNSNTTSTTLGKDYSGNGNNWTPNQFSISTGAGNDSLVDTPTRYGTDTGVGGEVRGNYATWNPLDKDDGISSVTEGNLKVVTNGSNGSIKATIPFPSGKWYWEVTSDSVSGSGTQAVGIMPQTQPPTNNMSDSGKLGYALDVSFSDRKFENGTATSYGSYTQGNGVVYMLAFDQDAGKLWYGVNGTWLASGAPATGSNPSSSSIPTSTAYCAAVSDNTVSGTFTVNFGNRPFAYAAPSGFKALCTTNLPEPTITDGDKHMNAVLWSGNDSARTITGYGFQPDMLWTKARNSAESHRIVDVVRGGNGTKLYELNTDQTAAEDIDINISGFASDGFNITAGANTPNVSGRTYVGWGWKGGGAGVSIPANTVGNTIASTVSANTTSGFSLVTFTGNGSAGATVGHGCKVGGLATAPNMVILKAKSSSNWWVYHSGVQAAYPGEWLYLNLAFGHQNTANAVDAPFYKVVPSSTTFSVAGDGANVNTTNYVAYCFAPVAGYSAFGSYTGASDGPFVYLGFRPRYLLIKGIDSTTRRWNIVDTARSTYNVSGLRIYAELSNQEDPGGGATFDLLSNGFKLRDSDGNFNAAGVTYIYAAFAENPFKYALAR